MLLFNCFIFCFVMFIGQVLGLVELPKVDENNILTTESAIRSTINTLFYNLGLRGIKTKPRLKKYSTVHDHLVAFTLQDYTNLKEIAKLTRVDKTKINNETVSFMTVINELLNEDVVEEKTEATITETNDESVIKYIDEFLTKLESLKEEYGVNNKTLHINNDVYDILKDDHVLSNNFTIDSSYNSGSEENDTLIDESSFWNESGRRIYKGKRSKIKYFPFMASIHIFNKFHCAGSIIKSDLVITASSCLQLAWNNRFFRENPAYLSVRVGSSFYYGGGDSIAVIEVYFHPNYNPKNLWNNVCLLRLRRHIRFKRRVKSVKKISFDTHASNLPMNTDGITIAGWGAKSASGVVHNPWENALTFAVLDVYPLQECQEIYSREYVTHKHFCAGFFSKGGGACNHDVGGPGISHGVLMGVISFGSPVCGTPDAPTVFTKLGYYTDWIEEIMEQEVPTSLQRTTLRPKFEIPSPQNVIPHQTTTFKIPPLAGKLKPVPISEVEALRMLQKESLFREFLKTMFDSKEAAEYEDLLQDNNNLRNDEGMEIEETTPSPPLELPVQVVEDKILIQHPIQDQIQDPIQVPAQIPTEMGIVDPEQEVEEEAATTPDYSTINIAGLGETVDRVEKSSNKLEKDLVDLIDNIDLKEIIDDMPSLDDEKLVNDAKIIDMFKVKELENKPSKTDVNVLPLLSLSDPEKDNGESAVKEYEDVDNEDEEEMGGLSIPTDTFRDLTYRNSNNSGKVQVPSKDENMYYLLVEALSNVKKEGSASKKEK
ncbi:hypothetical protein ABMA28_009547 [Loxostege sticticalis]|uniref:Peptidase S1 domain-containing protein n=1 Tax=Loxostege sticticalis TaxID=481309 RepID=A0ABD0SDN6_LOXSC